MNEILLTDQFAANVIRPRPGISYKGDFGHVVLIGGNEQYGGAIMMASRAAVYSGAGLTTVATAVKNHVPLHAQLPEVMVVPFEAAEKLIPEADVIVIGPGLGLEPDKKRLLKMVLASQKAEQWIVIDGSAITLYAQNPLPLKHPEKVVFTPHQMEWQRLSGIPIAVQSVETSSAAQKKLGAVIVAKSHRTTVFSQEHIWKNPIGTPAMATGGMGDTLAGMIGAFLGQFRTRESIGAAVYVHSWLGEELAQKRYVVLPSMIAEHIPQAMHYFESMGRNDPKENA
ncbi:MAG: NAD(P)H-hydrate dehydratase [Enterococcaceae bacterium]|jgi:hydroxyethylthiazole kinase-like uncharacterized protein yjeF|nr:NAD(P)H-hydrate dehydratase [Enterococcaceae bacterium]